MTLGIVVLARQNVCKTYAGNLLINRSNQVTCYSTIRPKSVRNRCVIEVFGSVC